MFFIQKISNSNHIVSPTNLNLCYILGVWNVLYRNSIYVFKSHEFCQGVLYQPPTIAWPKYPSSFLYYITRSKEDQRVISVMCLWVIPIHFMDRIMAACPSQKESVMLLSSKVNWKDSPLRPPWWYIYWRTSFVKRSLNIKSSWAWILSEAEEVHYACIPSDLELQKKGAISRWNRRNVSAYNSH